MFGFCKLFEHYVSSYWRIPEAAVEMFFKIGVLKNVAIFTGKHCVGVTFLAFMPATL